MDDFKFGKGAIKHIPDLRDYKWGRDVGMASAPFDWNKPYDVEEEVSAKLGTSFKITVKDQNGSSSCGGQAWAYYGQVLNAIHDSNLSERSAKFIYAQTAVPGGGSGAVDNCNLVRKQGWGLETDCTSYEDGKAPSEAFMTNKGDITAEAVLHASEDKAFAYAFLDHDLDLIAQAIRDNHGCIFGITGVNNGTWRSVLPQAPTTWRGAWNHWLYVGKVKMVSGKKYFGVLNSWGKDVGQEGWQWIDENYMLAMIENVSPIWCVLTMVMKAEVTPPVVQYTFTKLLKYRMSGTDVKMLQTKLGGLKVDGIFGPMTLAAVKRFQSSHGLVPDGVVGPLTNAELNKL